jgi:Ca2+/H+ antiporter
MAFAVTAALCVLGFLPTRRFAGDAGVPGMLVGCAIGFLSAAFAGFLIVSVPGDSPEAKMKRSFMAMAARLAAVIVLGAAAVLSGMFPTAPVLLWMAIAYMALLPLEVKLAL